MAKKFSNPKQAEKKGRKIPNIRVDKGQKHEWIELPIPQSSSGPKYMFPDQPNLRNVHAMRLKVFHQDIISEYPSGIKPLPNDILKNGFLTLQLFNGKEFYHQIPLVEILTYWGSSGVGLFPFLNMQPNNMNYQKINWTKSYVELFGNPVIEQDYSIGFSFYYSDILSVEEEDAKFEFNKNMR